MQCRYVNVLQLYNLLMHSYYALYRLEIAALHFNENLNREQTATKHGEKCYDIVYPKFKKGSYTVCKVLENATYGTKLFLL